MQLPQALIAGKLARRYKRFLADIILSDGTTVTAHCPNSGSMKSCLGDGWPVLLSYHNKATRKLKYTLELVHNGSCWIGTNTLMANAVTHEALERGTIVELAGYELVRPEVKISDKSRIDFVLENPGEQCFVEVKSVTYLDADANYAFPDAVTVRGLKHLQELIALKQQGNRAVMLFVVQRSDGTQFHAARDIDPAYAEGLDAARKAGVEILCYGTTINETGITLADPILISTMPSSTLGAG